VHEDTRTENFKQSSIKKRNITKKAKWKNCEEFRWWGTERNV